jgi:selenocysteine lyase/cysteine desulfurase
MTRPVPAALDVARVRAAFPATRHVTYLDLANRTLLPQPVLDEIERFAREAAGTGGDKEEWARLVEEARAEVAALIGAGPAEIAFVKNTAEGLNAAANALGLGRGDAVVLNDLEHPNNVYPWLHLARRGVEVRWVQSRGGRVHLADLLAELRRGARVVALSHVTASTGVRADLAALASACHAHGARLVVDAIQSIGVVPVDVHAAGVDLLAAGAHKGLLALHGVGILYCRRDLIPSLEPVYAARAGLQPGSAGDPRAGTVPFADDARRFELGNPNYLGIRALRVAVRFIRRLGVDAIEVRVRELVERLLDGLDRRGIETLTPADPADRAGIVSFRVADPGATVRRLAAGQVIVSERAGAVRASPHVYNTEEDVDRLLSEL